MAKQDNDEEKASSSSTTTPPDHLLKALDELCEGSKFLWIVFCLTFTSLMFSGMQSMSYVFTTEIPPHWCEIPDLITANWTQEQIKNISSKDKCNKYDYDYEYLSQLGYEAALNYVKRLGKRPNSSSCDSFSYGNTDRSSIVAEWNLVCDRATDRANTYMALALGKLLGAAVFGVIADKYGRKPTLVIGIIMQIISGPLSAIVPWFWGYMFLRMVTGISLSAVGYPALTMLTEASGSRNRQWLGIAFNIGFPVGIIMLCGVAMFFYSWRQLQMAISIVTLILLFHAWYMPESPRWLISQNRRKEAEKIVTKFYGELGETTAIPMIESNDDNNKKDLINGDGPIKDTFVKNKLMGFTIIYTNPELRSRLFIMWISWLSSSISYWALALNADNFTQDRRIYVLIMALTEIPAYILPSIMLMFMGRRQAGALLYLIGAICLLCILGIPKTNNNAIMAVAVIGRFCLAAVYGIIILYTSELFPTVVRNSAIGTTSVMAQVGTVSAPYIADLLGAIAWWAPSTICGALALVAGLSSLALPETRGRPLADTVEEETAPDREGVSFRKCC